jgi:hypothetical protein
MNFNAFSTLIAQVDGQLLLILGAGLGAAMLVILMGVVFLRQRQTRPSAKTPSLSSDDSWDGIDRREHERRSSIVPAVEIASPESSAIVTTGVIVDKSLGGLGLEVEEEIPEGARFRLRLRDAGPDADWALLEVRYARPKGNVWRIGCQFVDMSEWDVMQWLGPPDPTE